MTTPLTLPLTIRRASPREYDTVMGLLMGTVRWLRDERGLDQWSGWEKWPAKMRPALRRGDVWLLCHRREPIGTIAVETHGDPDFWTPDERADPAVYLNKGTIRRDYAGHSLGLLMLDWASDRAYRHGIPTVRFDVWKSNAQLRRYYRDHGWNSLRTVDAAGRRSGALFQTPSRPMCAADLRRIQEVPAMPTLLTFARAAEGPDAAGNGQPSHTHTGGLTVDYPWSDRPRRAELIPDMSYRVREYAPDAWTVESAPAGSAHWTREGDVVTADFPLVSGRTYVITHHEGGPCEMVLADQAANEQPARALAA